MIVALTHGAGSDANAALLRAVESGLTAANARVIRYNLSFRLQRASGPPRYGDAERDRAGIRDLLLRLRDDHPGEPLIAGGHSYGGRQTSMLAAAQPELLEGLLLLSYPLHPPRRREELRTAHFPQLRTPALFVQGTRDPFGLPEEVQSALQLIPAKTQLMLVEGAGHELTNYKGELGKEVARQATAFFRKSN